MQERMRSGIRTLSDAFDQPDLLPLADRRVRGIVEAHVDFVWRSLRRLGVCHADLPDAAQHVFLVAVRKLHRIKPESERSFLFQTALRVASDARRTRRRRREVYDDHFDFIEDRGKGPDEVAEERRCRRLLDQVLDGMTTELRSVFVLVELEQMTMAQAAVVAGIAPGTVASRLRRARQLFRERVRCLREPRER